MIFKKFNIENKKARDLIPQAITVLALLSVIIYFATNAQINMGNRGISFGFGFLNQDCLLYTSPSPRDNTGSRMPSSA